MSRYQIEEGRAAAPPVKASATQAGSSAPAAGAPRAERRSASRPWSGKKPAASVETAAENPAPRKVAAASSDDTDWQEF
jgi:hypothetical protein